MKKMILFWATAMALIACQRESEEIPSPLKPPPKEEVGLINAPDDPSLKWVALTENYYISEKEALDLALKFAQQTQSIEKKQGVSLFSKEDALEVESIMTVKNTSNYSTFCRAVTSEQNDLYIVNFKNSKGFVLTSADKRIPGIFAYSDKGHWEENTSNPVQKILYEQLLQYIDLNRSLFEERKDKLAQEALESFTKDLPKQEKERLFKKYFDEKGKLKSNIARSVSFDPDDPDCIQGTDYEVFYDDWELVNETNVLLKTEWKQRDGYNSIVKNNNCSSGRTPVGCVAVAVGQIMAYHKKPTVFNGRLMHWEEMTASPSLDFVSLQGREDIQHLLADLGNKEFLSINYTCENSGTSDENALNTFKKLGYVNAILSDKYDIEKDLLANRPVYISAVDKPRYDRTREAHAWVIDGYKKYRASWKEVIYVECREKIYKSYVYVPLIHHNLGWNSVFNLWYRPELTHSNSKKAFGNYPKMDRFPYDIKVITNIY